MRIQPALTRPRRTRPRRSTSGAVVLALAAGMSGAAALGLPLPAASAADPCLDPVVNVVNVSQGLPSYTNLVRGKTTLFKAFLTEKASSGGCTSVKSASEYVTGGSVTISNGTAATTLTVPGGVSLPAVAVNGTTLAGDNPADPVFAISGDKITSALSGPTTLTFTATLNYVAKNDSTGAVIQNGTVVVSTLPGTTTPITRPLAGATRPLRLLVVPMGDSSSSVVQYPSDASNTLQSAMLAASRIEPVADGVGDITGTTGGIRYGVASGLLNLGQHDELQTDGTLKSLNYMPNGTFCGSSASFTYIKQKLSDFRAAWNANNPSTPADRVLGVVWQGVSDGPTTNANSTCAEGYAAVNSAEAWVRLATPSTGSPSGGVAALELEHTYGGVVNGIGYHSSNTAADGTAPGRAYNTTTLRQIPAPKSAMRFDITGWDNYTTLYEQRDWDFTLCMLGSVNSPATECGSGTSGGTTAPAGGGLLLSGLTDLTAAGTDAMTRYDIDPPADGTDSGSALRLALLDSTGALVSDTGVRISNTDSEHDSAESGTSSSTAPRYVFDVAVPGAKAASFELWKGTPLASGSVRLYHRDLNSAPVIGNVTSRIGASAASRFTTDGASSAPSAGGTLVAVARGGQVVLSSTSSPAPLASVPGQGGELTDSGSTLVVTSGGDVLTYPLTRTAGGVTVGSPTTVYQGGGLLSPGAASSPVLAGSLAVFTVGGDLYSVDTTSPLLPVSSTTCGLGNALPLALLGNPCSRVTTTPAVERAGSWSAARGLLAYTSTTSAGPSVWTVAPATPSSATSRIAGVSDPAWAGDLLLVTGPSGIQAYDATTYAVPSAVTSSPGDGQATAVGSQVFFTRPAGAATDVWKAVLNRRTLVIPVTDETPQNIRLDLYADCGDGINPLVTATRPSAVSGSTATTEVSFSTDRTCAAPTIQIDATDGYSVSVKRLDGVAGTALPSAAIYSPRDGSTQLAYQPLVIAGEATGSFSYTLFGPAGSGYENGVPVGSSAKTSVQPPAGGFTPGVYRVSLTTNDPAGSYTTVSRVTVLADSDGDGIPDTDDSQAKHPCYPADAVTNPVNAGTDYDGDLLISLVDPDPCVSALNATVDFDANSINLGSAGTTLTVYVTTTAFDQRRLTAAGTRVTQLGSYPVNLVATSVNATSASQVTVKFSRQDFQNAYRQLGLSGYVPVLISGTNGSATWTGYDPDAPTYTP